MTFQRITLSHNSSNGRPCLRIRDLEFSVSRLLGLLATGETSETILKNHPELEAEDIQTVSDFYNIQSEDHAKIYEKVSSLQESDNLH